MAEINKLIEFDARKLAKEYLTVTVQVKKLWYIRIGLFFIKIGCWISGATYINEFPISLIQDDKPVEMNRDR